MNLMKCVYDKTFIINYYTEIFITVLYNAGIQ